jgi:hypothetical protein
MSLIIDIKKVKGVLLAQGGNEGYYRVEDSSFTLDDYRFTGLGEGKDHRMQENTWASWSAEKKKERYACPLSSILAVKYEE